MSDIAAIRVAGLGAGYFAGFHYAAWARIPGAVPVAACDTDIARAAATGLTAYDDLAQMLAVARPDLLDVIVPPAAHAAAIRTAITAGVPTIICQKPFCSSRDEAQAITQEAQAAGVTLVIHENFRFQPWYRAMAAALGDGAIGQVHQMLFRFRPGDGQGPRAYLDRQPYFQQMPRFLVHETAVHWIDTFRYLLGPPSAVYADLRRRNPVIAGEDSGVILFDHPDGVTSVFDGNRHIDHLADNTRRTMGEAWLEGSDGVLRLSGDGAVWLRTHGATQEQQILPPDRFDGFGGDCVHALQRHVIAHLREGTPPENTAPEYLSVMDIEAAVYDAAAQERKIKVPTP